MPPVWVEGEVGRFTAHRSGHWYFTLSDRRCRVQSVMWRTHNQGMAFTPREGEAVLAFGRVTVYGPRGAYQFAVERLVRVGEGQRAQAREALKRTLAAEGLFAPERKRPLPAFPLRLGVVTSPTGAAIRDILKVASRRAPGVRVVLSPARVEGPQAPQELVAALHRLEQMDPPVDVVVFGRGGGSREALLAFDDERVVRAVAGLSLPIVSGVGHEIDTSLCDLAADLRAATPSAAAEAAVPSWAALSGRVVELRHRLRQSQRSRLQLRRRQVDRLKRRVRDPLALVRRHSQRVDELAQRLERQFLTRVLRHRLALGQLHKRLQLTDPTRRLAGSRERLSQLRRRLQKAMTSRLEGHRRTLSRPVSTLQALSPLGVLGRGYAIAFRGEETLVRAHDVEVGSLIRVRLAQGAVEARVETRRDSCDALGRPREDTG